MASPATTETMEIRRRGRRRLVGAIAIVVLLVVFVPMILDSEPHQAANEPSTVIPPRDNAPALPPPSKAAPKPAPAAAPKPAAAGDYLVQRGDTLSSIASRQHVTGGYRALLAKNPALKNPNRIFPGQHLKV